MEEDKFKAIAGTLNLERIRDFSQVFEVFMKVATEYKDSLMPILSQKDRQESEKEIALGRRVLDVTKRSRILLHDLVDQKKPPVKQEEVLENTADMLQIIRELDPQNEILSKR